MSFNKSIRELIQCLSLCSCKSKCCQAVEIEYHGGKATHDEQPPPPPPNTPHISPHLPLRRTPAPPPALVGTLV